MEKHAADPVRGKTLRWTFTEGPTKGSSFEHTFHPDGTVEWHTLDKAKSQAGDANTNAKPEAERPKYAAMKIADDIVMVSYLSSAGYTLTLVLDFAKEHMVGFASNDKQWFPVKGTVEAPNGGKAHHKAARA